MIRKRNWDKPADAPWLKSNELHADPLGDLRTTDNALSVWLIHDDKSNLEQVIIALAVNRQQIDKFEYGLFDQAIPLKLDIPMLTSDGKTPIPDANRWHRDLVQLTADKLVDLAKAIFDKMERERLFHEEVAAKILAVLASFVDLSRLNTKIRKEIVDMTKRG